jgi:hypothetical protein
VAGAKIGRLRRVVFSSMVISRGRSSTSLDHCIRCASSSASLVASVPLRLLERQRDAADLAFRIKPEAAARPRHDRSRRDAGVGADRIAHRLIGHVMQESAGMRAGIQTIQQTRPQQRAAQTGAA